MESKKENNFKEWSVLEKIIFLYYGFAFFADLEIDSSEEEAIIGLVLNFSEMSDDEFIEIREKCLAKIVDLGSQPMFTSKDGYSVYLDGRGLNYSHKHKYIRYSIEENGGRKADRRKCVD